MKSRSALAPSIFLLFAPVWDMAAQGQERQRTTKNEVVWTQEFLRALYPSLNEKKLTMTVETAVPYDEQPPRIRSLTLYVGEGFKYFLMGYSGCLNEPPVPEGAPLPPGLAPTPPTPTQEPREQVSEPCKPGPMYPKQFLTAGFQFDTDGRFTNFGADGSLIDDRKDDKEVYEIVRAHPQMTYAEIVSTMKQHGTKYGPDDKEQFIKDLPLKELEPFLGKLRIVSVTFRQMDKDSGSVPWVDRWLWPDWTVKVQATTKDGANVPYELHFSHLNGYLTGLLDCRSSPSCSRD